MKPQPPRQYIHKIEFTSIKEALTLVVTFVLAVLLLSGCISVFKEYKRVAGEAGERIWSPCDAITFTATQRQACELRREKKE